MNNSNKEFLCPLTQNIKEKNCEQQIRGIGGFPQIPNRIKVPLVYYKLPFDKDQLPSQITLQIRGEELNENYEPTGKFFETKEFIVDLTK